MQQSSSSRTSTALPRQAACQRSRPGSAEASRLSGPPASTACALPDQTVPRASASSSRCCVAEATPRASQFAGAKAMQRGQSAEQGAGEPPSARRRRASGPRRVRRCPGRMPMSARGAPVGHFTGRFPGLPPACRNSRPSGVRVSCASSGRAQRGAAHFLQPGGERRRLHAVERQRRTVALQRQPAGRRRAASSPPATRRWPATAGSAARHAAGGFRRPATACGAVRRRAGRCCTGASRIVRSAGRIAAIQTSSSSSAAAASVAPSRSRGVRASHSARGCAAAPGAAVDAVLGRRRHQRRPRLSRRRRSRAGSGHRAAQHQPVGVALDAHAGRPQQAAEALDL